MSSDPLGLALMVRARARGAAYFAGLDDAMDGRYCPEQVPAYRVEYDRGYQDGRAQLRGYATRVPVVNRARENG